MECLNHISFPAALLIVFVRLPCKGRQVRIGQGIAGAAMFSSISLPWLKGRGYEYAE